MDSCPFHAFLTMLETVPLRSGNREVGKQGDL
jgi:hypothetical protein